MHIHIYCSVFSLDKLYFKNISIISESQVVRKDDTDNKMPFLTIEIDENSSTMRSDNEHIVNRARRKGQKINKR